MKRSLPPGQPKKRAPDIREVAAQAGVSISSVSRFLNKKPVRKDAEGRIAAAIRDLGYRPNRIARSLKARRTMTIGMVLPDITNAFFPELVKGAEVAARAAGFQIFLANTAEDSEEEWERLETLRALHCDGVLLTPASTATGPAYQRRMETYDVPIVYIDRRPAFAADVITSDNLSSAEEATAHLIRLGHRRIALLNARLGVTSHDERAEGFRRAMAKAGLPVPPEHACSVPPSVADGFAATLRLLQTDSRPTALFVTSNRLTIGAMSAIHSQGFACPEQVAVVGFDDHEWEDAFRPRLTTVAQPAYLMGQRAAEMLIARITGVLKGPVEELVLRAQLIVRESCGLYAGRQATGHR